MRRLLAVIIGLAIFCLPVIVLAADKKAVSFAGAGVWRLERMKSDLFPKTTTGPSGGIAICKVLLNAYFGSISALHFDIEQSNPLIIGQCGPSFTRVSSREPASQQSGPSNPWDFYWVPVSGQSGPLIIEQFDNSIRITNNVFGDTIVGNYKLRRAKDQIILQIRDESIKTQMGTQVTWTKDKIVITETFPDYPLGKVTAKRSFELSRNGKSLTMSTEITDEGCGGGSIADGRTKGSNSSMGGGTSVNSQRSVTITAKMTQIFSKLEDMKPENFKSLNY
jgi:hypothetical protein